MYMILVVIFDGGFIRVKIKFIKGLSIWRRSLVVGKLFFLRGVVKDINKVIRSYVLI